VKRLPKAEFAVARILFVWTLLVVSGVTRYSGIAGSVSLAIIMLPIIGRSTEEILRLVHQLKQSSTAPLLF